MCVHALENLVTDRPDQACREARRTHTPAWTLQPKMPRPPAVWECKVQHLPPRVPRRCLQAPKALAESPLDQPHCATNLPGEWSAWNQTLPPGRFAVHNVVCNSSRRRAMRRPIHRDVQRAVQPDLGEQARPDFQGLLAQLGVQPIHSSLGSPTARRPRITTTQTSRPRVHQFINQSISSCQQYVKESTVWWGPSPG